MNNEALVDEKPKVFKRVIAFFIDILVVSLLAGIISSTFIDTKKYEEVTQEMSEIITKYSQEEIALEEFQARSRDLNYEMVASSINITIVTLVITIVYYTIMPYFCHGITLGKYLMKIRIISNNDKDLNIINYGLRSLIINTINQEGTINSTFMNRNNNSKKDSKNKNKNLNKLKNKINYSSSINDMIIKSPSERHNINFNININMNNNNYKKLIYHYHGYHVHNKSSVNYSYSNNGSHNVNKIDKKKLKI